MKKAFAITVAVLLAIIAAQAVLNEHHKVKYAELQLDYANYIGEQAAVSLERSIEHRVEVESVGKAGDEKLEELQIELDIAQRDNDGMRTELSRLRQPRNTTAANQCKAEYERIRELTRVFDECTTEYLAMAGIAKSNRVRGLTCERAYDAISESADSFLLAR